jgi:hypothetical protein
LSALPPQRKFNTDPRLSTLPEDFGGFQKEFNGFQKGFF